jgi:ABC-type nitrate/sulfonate/bicarbonate transport system permease component
VAFGLVGMPVGELAVANCCLGYMIASAVETYRTDIL